MCISSFHTYNNLQSSAVVKAFFGSKEHKLSANTSPKTTRTPRTKHAAGSIKQWALRVEEAARQRGMSRIDTATYLEISTGYWNTLLTGGGSNQSEVGRDLLQRSASLLNTSLLTVYLLCGLLQPEDLYFTTDHEAELAKAYRRMCEDIDLASHLPTPAEWEGKKPMSIRTRYGYALLYELATQKTLLEKASLVST